MLNTAVSIEEFRSNLAELIGRVMYGRDRIIIKKYNKDAAVLLSVDEYEKLIDPAKRFSKGEWDSKFALIGRIRERIPEVDQEVLESEIARVVKEVRVAKRKNAR